MADVFKFPNDGYEVTVLRRQDVLDSIDKNILDKDVALAIVEHCETAAANFLRQGRWTGIPFMGNIRIPKVKQMEATPEQQALISEAKDLLTPNDYIIFRHRLSANNCKQIKYDRYYRYITSLAVSKNRKLYRKLCKEKGETYARIFMFSIGNITAVDNEYVLIKERYDE